MTRRSLYIRRSVLFVALSIASAGCGGGAGPVNPSVSSQIVTSRPLLVKATRARSQCLPSCDIDWDSFGFDLERTGYNPIESSVGAGNVSSLEKLWVFNVGSYVVHEPVVAHGVSVNGHLTDILYAGSAYGSTMYAIDTSSGTLVWKDAVPYATYNCGTKSHFSIGETPAIDRAKNRLYFADGHDNVHALDLGTGKEAKGWPLTIADTPNHNFMHGGFTYNPANGLLYAVTGSTCDISPWYGRIVAIDTRKPSVVGRFYPMSGTSTQGRSGGGIWGPGGASIDPLTKNVFVATGNGDTSDGVRQAAAYAEQIIELSPRLGAILANNHPANIPRIEGDNDFDFGATPLLFQSVGCPPMLAAINKSGMFELYDRATISSGPIQYIPMSAPSDDGIFIGVPAFDPITNYIYVGLPTNQGIYHPGIAAFRMRANCTLDPRPAWSAVVAAGGGWAAAETRLSPISIANGVVYVSSFIGDTEEAFDAATGALLWHASLLSRGNVGTVIANGIVYVTAGGGNVTAWTLPATARALQKTIHERSNSTQRY